MSDKPFRFPHAPEFAPLTIDAQIENLKYFYARRLADLERDYQVRRAGYEFEYAQEMQELLEKRSRQDGEKEQPA